MIKNEIGRFSATSFDDMRYEFIVYDDNTIYCPMLNLISFKNIELKPRFRIWY